MLQAELGDEMQELFHAFEVDLNDMDMMDIGLYRSEAEVVLGLAQYILSDIADEHAFHFLSGDVELPWGYPSADEVTNEKLDWGQVRGVASDS